MKLKLDENLSRHLKAALQALGQDVMTASATVNLGEKEVIHGHNV